MAYEDAWKASNPDFRTPSAGCFHTMSSRSTKRTTSTTPTAARWRSAQKWDVEVEATQLKLIAEFEKQVLAFNVMARRGEERLMPERALLLDERRQTERARAALQNEQQEEEAARARLALAQAQAAIARPLVQPMPTAWQQALAAAAMARGEGFPGAAGKMVAQGVAMHPQQDPGAEAGAWQMMQQQQQQLGLGVWPTFVAPRGEGSSNGQVGPPAAVLQEQAGGLTTSGGAATAGMAQPWWASGAQRREQ